MLETGKIFSLFTIFFFVHSQIIRILAASDTEPELEANCLQWNRDKTICLKCDFFSYFNRAQKKCLFVTDNCKKWNQTTGKCEKCYLAFGADPYSGKPVNGKCPIYKNTIGSFTNCAEFDAYDTNKCAKCSPNYGDNQNNPIDNECPPQTSSDENQSTDCLHYDQNGYCTDCGLVAVYDSTIKKCIKITENCRDWNETTGKCIKCRPHFGDDEINGKPIQGRCPLFKTPAIGYTQDSCIKWNPTHTRCDQCSSFFAFWDAIRKKCLRVVYNCASWKPSTGQCQTCYTGYGDDASNGKPINGECPVYQNTKDQYPCYKWNSDKTYCEDCGAGNTFNEDTKKCSPFAQNCGTWDADPSKCLTCKYSNVQPVNGQCPLDKPVVQNNEPKCVQYNQDKTECVKYDCGETGVYDPVSKKCVQKPENCAQWNKQTGECTLCFTGYGSDASSGTPLNGKCPPFVSGKVTANCYDWDPVTFVCYKCMTGYGDHPSNGRPVNGLCKPYQLRIGSSRYSFDAPMNYQNLDTLNMLTSMWV